MAACRLLWCPKNSLVLAKFMTEDFGPLLLKHWEKEKERTGVEHGIDMPSFMASWEQKGIALIMAYEGDKAVGFLPLFVFRPIFFTGVSAIVERWYADTPEIEAAMIDYVISVCPILGVDYLHFMEHVGQKLPVHVKKNPEDTYTMTNVVMP